MLKKHVYLHKFIIVHLIWKEKDNQGVLNGIQDS